MKTIYKTLEQKRKRRRPFKRGEEYAFFSQHHALLQRVPRFSFLDNSNQDEFEVMRANIILHSFLNKQEIEEEMVNFANYIKAGENIDHVKILQTLRERMVDKPYYKDDKERIYIPFFSRTLNALYNHEPEKLLTSPYSDLKEQFRDSVIDPFDTFGAELFNSNFTKLIRIDHKENVTAFFHYDTNTIYFVNSQGRMDSKLVLFDKYMRRPSYSHMLDRVKPVVAAYFSDDREALLASLKEQKLVSPRIIAQINKKRKKR